MNPMEQYLTSDGKNGPNFLFPESVEISRALLAWRAAKRRRLEIQATGANVAELQIEERAAHADLLRLRIGALEERAAMCRDHLAVTLADLRDYQRRLARLENLQPI